MSLQVDDVLAALDGMGVGELRRVVSSAEAKIRDKAETEKRALKEEVERRAADLGVTVRDLFGDPVQPAARRGRKPAAAKKAEGDGPAPKYKGPDGELWSGRGRTPRWLQAAQAEGRSKDDFLIAR
jgi:DNA-binding protein H-NS